MTLLRGPGSTSRTIFFVRSPVVLPVGLWAHKLPVRLLGSTTGTFLSSMVLSLVRQITLAAVQLGVIITSCPCCIELNQSKCYVH